MTGLAPEWAALVDGLRGVRARTGLSLAALGERTPYSKSSWERYLNGKKPVPRTAVENLCQLAGEPAGRLLALWELADAQWSGRAVHVHHTPQDEGDPGDGRPTVVDTTARLGHPWPLALSAAAVLLSAAALTTLWVGDAGGGRAAGAASPLPSPLPRCQGAACEGQNAATTLCAATSHADTPVDRQTRTGAHVMIRRSRVCGTVWGRMWGMRVGDAVEIAVTGHRPRRVVALDEEDAQNYLATRMVVFRDLDDVRVCFLPAHGDRQCFGAT